ncbi:hypothetical protein [Streptomyces sp. NPDC051219]|uniref:hypothetical protein n=1 Tax=Streptomyces sp. NPDC051219 TaxID=3155283 RepID=UPI00344A4CF2
MEAAILILTLLFVAFVGLGVYVSVKAVAAAKRGVDRTISQARRTVEETTLRAKSYGQGGLAGELAQLRLSLRTSMRSTQSALNEGVRQDASLSESIGLFQRLSAHGHELDDELKHLERDPDRARVAERMPDLRERTERITHAADSLRWAARDRARQFADDDLTALSAQIEVESGALRDWSKSSWPEPAPADESPAAGAGSRAGSGSGSGSGPATGPAPAPVTPTLADPQALTGAEPLRQAEYPWQKTARPESTT